MELTNRQSEIVEKSIEIIANQGIQGLTIKNLSKEIGVSEPAIYRHFASKTDILLTILNNFKEMAAFLGEAMKDSNEPAIARIDFMFSKIIELFSENHSFISVIFSEEIFKNDNNLKSKIIEILDMNEKTVEHIIKSGQASGEIRTDLDYRTLSLIIMGTLRFRVKMWDLKEKKKNLNKEGKQLIDSLKTILEK